MVLKSMPAECIVLFSSSMMVLLIRSTKMAVSSEATERAFFMFLCASDTRHES